MQLTPLETHLTPFISLAHWALKGIKESSHYLSRQELKESPSLDSGIFSQKQIPSVP